MGGQSSTVAYEQTQSFDLVDSADTYQEVQDNQISDPIASFLEKHGSTLIANHEGQMVTVSEAIANCIPFARMVEAMGEGALFLVATPRPEEGKQEEAEEPESEETREKEKLEEKTETKTANTKRENGNDRIETEKTDTGSLAALRAKNQSIEKPAENVAKMKVEAPAPTGSVSTKLVGEGPADSQETVFPISTRSKKTSAGNTIVKEVSKLESIQSDVEMGVQPVRAEVIAKAPPDSEAFTPTSVINEVLTSPAIIEAIELSAQDDMEVDKVVLQIPVDTISEILDRQDAESSDLESAFTPLAEEERIDSSYREALHIDESEGVDLYISEHIALAQEASEEEEVSNNTIPYGETTLLALQEMEYENPAPELNMPIKEAETTLDQLAERLETLEAEEAEASHKLLDKIMEVPAKMDISDRGEFVNEEAIRDELESLFGDLFERVGVEYTPDLVNAFVELSLNHYLEETNEAKINGEVEEETPLDKGTHELITKLLVGLTDIKKPLIHAYMIGKSAVRLYALDYAFTRAS